MACLWSTIDAAVPPPEGVTRNFLANQQSVYFVDLFDYLGSERDGQINVDLKRKLARYVVRQAALEPRLWRTVVVPVETLKVPFSCRTRVSE